MANASTSSDFNDVFGTRRGPLPGSDGEFTMESVDGSFLIRVVDDKDSSLDWDGPNWWPVDRDRDQGEVIFNARSLQLTPLSKPENRELMTTIASVMDAVIHGDQSIPDIWSPNDLQMIMYTLGVRTSAEQGLIERGPDGWVVHQPAE